LLNSVSGLVQADFTKLAAINSTAAELNLLDALDRGSILYGNPSGVTTVLGQGTTDQVLTSDGNDISWECAGGGGARTREGGDTTEATTSSTSAMDIIAVGSLNIEATEPIVTQYVARKEAGALFGASTGLALNNTTIAEPTALYSCGCRATGWAGTKTDRAENGGASIYLGPRLTNYTGFAISEGTTKKSVHGADNNIATGSASRMTVTANMPTATITDVDIRGITGHACITLGVDEMHVYSWATS